jgi:hypothetical protein
MHKIAFLAREPTFAVATRVTAASSFQPSRSHAAPGALDASRILDYAEMIEHSAAATPEDGE